LGRKILLIDDDPELGKLVELALREVEVTIYQACSGEEGLRAAYDIHPDLVIADVMLPAMDGFNVCCRLREFSSVPILMLTACTNDAQMMRGFQVGVDDYVRKPFKKDELEARVRALLRRSDNDPKSPASHITAYSDSVLDIDLTGKTVRLCGETLALSVKEYELLAYLVLEEGKLVSHTELSRKVWGGFLANSKATVCLYIHYLREKLQDGQHRHHYIRTQWGRGYWFERRVEG
jgi:two-component system KDP operon response regulator KdpE